MVKAGDYFFFAGSFAASTAFSAAAFAAAESLFASLAASLASFAAFDAAAASAGAGVTTVVGGEGVTTVGDAVGAAGVTTTGVVAGRLSHAASANAARTMQKDVFFMIFPLRRRITLVNTTLEGSGKGEVDWAPIPEKRK